MKQLILTLLYCVGLMFMRESVASESPAPSGVVHIDHDAVAKAFKSGAPLVVTNNFKVQTGNRTAPGEVEVHETDTDIFYILEGSATFVTGGEPVNVRSVGLGETRGSSIKGGETRTLKKGDVIVIPNRVPHWFKAVDSTCLYYVVKVKS